MLWFIPLVYLSYYYYTKYQSEKKQWMIYNYLKSIEKELMQYEYMYPLYLIKNDIIENEYNQENKLVGEETPEGFVSMMYDDFTKSFFYWSKKPISYKYLNTVARKYVIYYDCKELYINKHTLEKIEEPAKTDILIKKIVKPVLKNSNIFKWIGKEYVKEEKKEVEIKSISYAEFIKNKK